MRYGKTTPSYRGALFLGTAIAVALWAGNASAQQAVASSDQLEQVTVTATRATSTVNQVSLSITAETQASLDQQGIKDVQDLVATVPGFTINQSLGTGLANIAIRGIFQGNQGSATTGFYLDDTALQKRNVGGGVATSNGTPLPPIFDLERIEVLRGPQGTLYGGSSEGGTVRMITPEPNLDHYEAYGRASVSSIQDGGVSYDAGMAVGGPIIHNQLGFRVSYYRQHRAGWLDIVDPFTAKVGPLKDVNKVNTSEFRGKLLWQPVDNFQVELSYFNSFQGTPYALGAHGLSVNGQVSIPQSCYDTTNPYIAGGLPSVPNPVASGANCQTSAAVLAAQGAGDNIYVRPAETFGPYHLSSNQVVGLDYTPARTMISVPALSVQYDIKNFATIKVISSYIHDKAKTTTDETSQSSRANHNTTYNGLTVGTGFVYAAGPLWYAPWGGFPQGTEANLSGHFISVNKRWGITEELRVTSDTSPDNPSDRLSWVAGMYYSLIKDHAGYNEITGDLTRESQADFGITTLQRYGVPYWDIYYEPLYGGNNHFYGISGFDHKDQQMRDEELAFYGQANYWVTESLQATAGLRWSHDTFDYHQTFFGPVNSNNTPTYANGLESAGHQSEYPLTPKFGLRYNLSNDDFVYASAAKGFRPGGVNAQTSKNICGPALAQYGLVPQDVPTNYKSDSVWSYELGTKLRLLDGRMQVNGDVYRIDWTNVQSTQSPGFGCGIVFTANAGTARSQGIEVETEARLFEGLTSSVAFTYDDAQYTQDAVAIHGPIRDLIVAVKGQKFAMPPWTLDIGARYDWVVGDYNPYFRVDWRHAAGYYNSLPQLGTYQPDNNDSPATDMVNIRAGIGYTDYDVSLFVTNVFNTDKGPLGGGRSGCLNNSCSAWRNYNPFMTVSGPQPRTVGLQVTYRGEP